MSEFSHWPKFATGNIFYVKGRIGWRNLRRSDFCESGPYLITGMHIGDTGRVDWDACFHIPSRKYDESPEIKLQFGDLVITKDGTIGKVALIDWLPGDASLNSHLFLVRPIDSQKCSARFAFHIFQSPAFRRFIDAQKSGSTLVGLGEAKFIKFEFPLPEKSEQDAVSKILDVIDVTIRETEAIADKLKAVKQGMLHDLLTRGIGADGELRPPPVQAPQLYKLSPLGWIPKAWEIKELSELLADVDPAMRSGPFGSALLKQELVEAGVPLLGIDNVHTERFAIDYQRFVTPRKFLELSRYAVRPADLMITIMGTVGRCCLVPESIGQALSSKHTWAITLDQQLYSPYLAMLQINYSPWVLQHFAQDRQGGTMMAIRSDTLRSTLFPTPPIDEQRQMEDRLRKISLRIDLEGDTARKMQALKTGLMDDLLTGRVRVTPLLDQAAEQKIKRSA
jgi:type I restriction enzyme S subunit